MSGVFLLLFAAAAAASFYFYKQMNKFKDQAGRLQTELEEMNQTFLKVRSERHDFLKHISAVQYMMEKGQTEEAISYMDGLVGGYEETNLSIKGETGAVAGLLHHMYKRARKAGINIVYDFEIPLSSLPVPDQDIIGLAGNLLANSIEACEEWQKERSRPASITLQFSKRSGLFLLSCTNESLPIPVHILDRLFVKAGVSTKSGEHTGTGTKIIQDCVKAHHGFLDFIHKEETFSLKVKIPSITK
ncbi:sensor histidine kinase [Domibacillus indicus]|uniref:sensor histidine kinase n=1 Tax=Domibacillus indicus TaxID=1437523 RepID=UPI000697276D|nr:GHKL domain-containing protein [Domibacillus indicus]